VDDYKCSKCGGAVNGGGSYGGSYYYDECENGHQWGI